MSLSCEQLVRAKYVVALAGRFTSAVQNLVAAGVAFEHHPLEARAGSVPRLVVVDLVDIEIRSHEGDQEGNRCENGLHR
jgi:hypothetical protein